jgi:hypothetical protein
MAGPRFYARGACLLTLLIVAVPVRARGEVFHSKTEALALAFPADVTVRPETAFLTREQLAAVKERSGVEPDSELFTYYVGRRGDDVVGYAVIETHVVRTLPETILAVLTPDGRVDRVVLLAFHEPREYMPPERWLRQFDGRALDGQGWRLGHDIHGISGATLTADAIPRGLRKILLLHDLVMRPSTP